MRKKRDNAGLHPLPYVIVPTAVPASLRIAFAFCLVAINTIAHCTPLFLLALLKPLAPRGRVRDLLSRGLIVLAESWIGVNSRLIGALTPTRWEVTGLNGLNYGRSYLVLCNHQSWVDIPVLQAVLTRQVPFLRFFLKSQLFWVPVLGLAWWALDFPFMKRYSREFLERHPELRGADIAATRKACAKFREVPVSVMNFVEGTRFTAAKHARQGSPYAHLLKPKSGGVAFVLDAMGDALHTVLDVTLVYPGGRQPSVADLFAGRIGRVRVDVRERPIPDALLGGDYENDAEYRARFQDWINGLWADKDRRISELLGAGSGPR